MGVESCQEARQALDQGGFSAMVCYETLPDGNWYCLLEEIVLREDETNMIRFRAAATLRVSPVAAWR